MATFTRSAWNQAQVFWISQPERAGAPDLAEEDRRAAFLRDLLDPDWEPRWLGPLAGGVYEPVLRPYELLALRMAAAALLSEEHQALMRAAEEEAAPDFDLNSELGPCEPRARRAVEAAEARAWAEPERICALGRLGEAAVVFARATNPRALEALGRKLTLLHFPRTLARALATAAVGFGLRWDLDPESLPESVPGDEVIRFWLGYAYAWVRGQDLPRAARS